MIKRKDKMLNVSLRESRLIIERILLSLGVDVGFVKAMVDTFIVSESIGLNSYYDLSLPKVRARIKQNSVNFRDTGLEVIFLDGQSNIDTFAYSPYLVSRFVVDVLATLHKQGITQHLLLNIDQSKIGIIISRLLSTKKISCDFSYNVRNNSLSIESHSMISNQDDNLFRKEEIEGFSIPEELWWNLYYK